MNVCIYIKIYVYIYDNWAHLIFKLAANEPCTAHTTKDI